MTEENYSLLSSLIQSLSLLNLEIQVPLHSVCISIHISDSHCLLHVLYAFCLHGAMLSFVMKGSDLSIKHTTYFENIVQSNMHPSMFT